MLAVQTKRTRRGSRRGGRRWRSSLLDHRRGRSSLALLPARPTTWGRSCSTSGGAEVEVAGVGEGVDDVLEGVVDGAAGGVDADVGVLRLLVGRGDAGELGDLAAAGLGVEALAVAALALLQRGGHVDEEEGAAGLVDHGADLLAGLVEGGDRADHGQAAVAGDLGGDPADAADVGLAVLLGEGQTGREVAAHDVAVERGDGAGALLEDAVHQRAGEGGLAAAGEAGEEEDQPLLVGRGLVGVHDRGDVVGVGRVGRRRQGQDRAAGGVGVGHLGAEGVVGLGVAAAGEGHRDDDGVVQAARSGQGGADQGGGSQVRGAVADQGQQQHRPGRGQLLDLLLGQRVDHGDDRAPGVLLAHLGRGQVVAPERSVLRVRQRLHAPRGQPDAGQRQALGVHQLDSPGGLRLLVDAVGQAQRDRAAGLVELLDRCERAGHQQLEVVELAGAGAVLRKTHRSILTDSVEFQRPRAVGLRCRA